MKRGRAPLFARRVFQIAGWVGLAETIPLFFTERLVGIQAPPALTHSEFFYGFLGVVAVWQIVFLVLAADPYRYRPLMIPAMLEKASFVLVVIGTSLRGRTSSGLLGGAALDLLWLGLFVLAYVKTTRSPPT